MLSEFLLSIHFGFNILRVLKSIENCSETGRKPCYFIQLSGSSLSGIFLTYIICFPEMPVIFLNNNCLYQNVRTKYSCRIS